MTDPIEPHAQDMHTMLEPESEGADDGADDDGADTQAYMGYSPMPKYKAEADTLLCSPAAPPAIHDNMSLTC